MPVGVRRVARHAAVVVGRSVGPPRRPALAEGVLGRVHGRACGAQGVLVAGAARRRHRAPGGHQGAHLARALLVGQRRVRAAPQPAAHHEVAAVGRDGKAHAAPSPALLDRDALVAAVLQPRGEVLVERARRAGAHQVPVHAGAHALVLRDHAVLVLDLQQGADHVVADGREGLGFDGNTLHGTAGRGVMRRLTRRGVSALLPATAACNRSPPLAVPDRRTGRARGGAEGRAVAGVTSRTIHSRRRNRQCPQLRQDRAIAPWP